jgi:hypothetical protein
MLQPVTLQVAAENPMPGPERTYPTNRERQAAYRQRRAEREHLVDRLLVAVRNARLDDPELHQAAQRGEDNELLNALVMHYQARNWNRKT